MSSPQLTRPQLANLNKGLSALTDAVAAADKAEAAGIDVTEQRGQIEYLRDRLVQVKQIFSPQG